MKTPWRSDGDRNHDDVLVSDRALAADLSVSSGPFLSPRQGMNSESPDHPPRILPCPSISNHCPPIHSMIPPLQPLKDIPVQHDARRMDPNPLKQGVLTHGTLGVGSVTRGMVRQRAMELAVIDGRLAQDTSKLDWEEARLELTGRVRSDPQATAVDSLAESGDWDPVPASTGGRVPVAPGEDEDEEGRSDQERLVEEGLAGADFDHRLQAAESENRQTAKSDLGN